MNYRHKPSIGGWIAILYVTLPIGALLAGLLGAGSISTIVVSFLVALAIAMILWQLAVAKGW